MTRTQVLERLGELAVSLASAYRELSELEAAENQAKASAWIGTQGTLGERDGVARFNALDLTTDVIKLKGDIRAWQEERDHLRDLLPYAIDA